MITISEVEQYERKHTLTRIQSRITGSCKELIAENASLKGELAAVRQRLADVEAYQRRANVKPTVLLVQDLARHGAVTVYGNPQEVSTKRLVVYPWQNAGECLSRGGSQWQGLAVLDYLESPYEGEFTLAKAMELEAKRATIEGCERVIAMKQAIADAVDIITQLKV